MGSGQPSAENQSATHVTGSDSARRAPPLSGKDLIVRALTIQDPALTHKDVRVLALLCRYGIKDGVAWRAYEHLAVEIGTGVDNMRGSLSTLQKLGYITRVENAHRSRSPRFRINWDNWPTLDDW